MDKLFASLNTRLGSSLAYVECMCNKLNWGIVSSNDNDVLPLCTVAEITCMSISCFIHSTKLKKSP